MRWSKTKLEAAAIAALGAVSGTAVALAAPPMMTVNTGAHLKVLSPKTGTTMRGNTLSTRVSITHFKVDCRYAGKANRKGVGHYHIELDQSLINMFCGPRGSVSMQNVAPGRHTLAFVPAENNHMDDLPAAKKVSFVYKPSHPLPTIKPAHFNGKPSVKIVSPKAGSSVHGSFDLKVEVKNFHLSCALYGKPDVAGYGHWHANLDTATKGMMGMGTMLGMSCGKTFHVSLAAVKHGRHKFVAILEDNVHAPTIGAQDAIYLNVR